MQGRTNEEISKVIARGRDAYQDYTLVEKKIAEFKTSVYDAFSKTKPKEDIERRNLWQALQIAEMVLEYLLSDIREGRHAIRQLEEIKRVGKPTLLERILP